MSQTQAKAVLSRSERRARFQLDRITFRHLLFLSVISFALYIPTLRSGFVADDDAEVLQDRLIRSFSNIPSFFSHGVWFFLTGDVEDRFYRPLKLLAYSVEYQLFRFQPAYWHLANIILDMAVVIAAYFLVRDLASREL